MSDLAAGIPIGLAAGMGTGIAIGIGSGKQQGKKEIADAIRAYAATHDIRITGSSGAAITLEDFLTDVTTTTPPCTMDAASKKQMVWLILGILILLTGVGVAALLYFLR